MHELISFLTKVWRGSPQNCPTRVWKMAGNIITSIALSMFLTAGASADPGWVRFTYYFYPSGSCRVYDDSSGEKIIIGQGKLLDLNKLDAAVVQGKAGNPLAYDYYKIGFTLHSTGGATNQSRDPSIVGYLDNGPDTPYHAFRKQDNDGPVDLGALGGNDSSSFAYGVSSDGSVVVGASYLDPEGLTEHAFVWTETNGMVDLGSSSGPGGFSRAFGVSGDGSVVVGEEGGSPFSGTNAFIWTASGGFQDLGVGTAYAITADASTVVGQANYATAFLWNQASGMQDLGSLPGYSNSVATGVSDDGQVVVGFAAPRPIAYLDASGFDYDIDCLPFVWTAATGMQDLNQLLANAGVDLTGITLYAITGYLDRRPIRQRHLPDTAERPFRPE